MKVFLKGYAFNSEWKLVITPVVILMPVLKTDEYVKA